jgi:hypothetical protein
MPIFKDIFKKISEGKNDWKLKNKSQIDNTIF